MNNEHQHTYKWYRFGCKDATYMQTKSSYTKLSFGENLLYRFHLIPCEYCRRVGVQLGVLEYLIRRGSEYASVELSEKRKNTVNQAITEYFAKK